MTSAIPRCDALPTEVWSHALFTAMIIVHFHLQPQYKYELFHIYVTSFHCTGRYKLNKFTSLPMSGFIAQLIEHRTGIAEVTGSNPVEALIFFQVSSFQLLKLENLLRWSFFTFKKTLWPRLLEDCITFSRGKVLHVTKRTTLSTGYRFIWWIGLTTFQTTRAWPSLDWDKEISW